MKLNRKNKFQETRRKGIYILPSLFTSASLFGGFYAIIAAIQGRFEAAAIAIFISAVFDGLDGRVARFTGTASHFGTEYDSLADLVAFGVTPAIVAYLWAMESFGRLGWLAAFMYVICGALRLARFNVEKENLPSNYFKGLPIPIAACFIASVILFSNAIQGFTDSKHILIIIMIYALSFLMVSSVKYPSFKEFNIKNQRPFNVLVSIILIFTFIAYKPKILLFVLLSGYIISGLSITLYQFHTRQTKRKREFANPSTEKIKNDIDELNDQEITG